MNDDILDMLAARIGADEDVVRDHVGEAIDVARHDGTLRDLDVMVGISRVLGVNPGWDFYHYANTRYDGDLMELTEHPDEARPLLERYLHDRLAPRPHVAADDIAMLSDRIDARLYDQCRCEGFRPFETLYRIGENGYVTQAEWWAALDGEPDWARAAYKAYGNGMDARTIADAINRSGFDGVEALNDTMFYEGRADNLYCTQADDEGRC